MEIYEPCINLMNSIENFPTFSRNDFQTPTKPVQQHVE